MEKTSVVNPLIHSNCIGSVLMNSVNSCAPFVNILVGEVCMSSLVDTGSLNVSVLSEDFWKQVCQRIPALHCVQKFLCKLPQCQVIVFKS